MKKPIALQLSLLLTCGGLAIFRGVFEPWPEAGSGGSVGGSATMRDRISPREDALEEGPQVAAGSIIPEEMVMTSKSVGARTLVEFLARRSQGRTEGQFADHEFTITHDRRTGRMAAISGRFDLDSIVTAEKSLEEKIREISAFGRSGQNVCRIESTRIHQAVPGQLPNRADTLIEAEMRLNGTARPVSIAARTQLAADGQFTLQAEFTIDRKAFGLPLEQGSAGTIRDELVIRLDMVAERAGLHAVKAIPEAETIRPDALKAAQRHEEPAKNGARSREISKHGA